jgi:hypothetical protein
MTDGDTDLVAAFMRALAAEAAEPRALPDAQAILRRARLVERLEAEQQRADRVARPILVAGLLAPFGVAVFLSTLPDARGPAVAVTAGIFCALASSLALRLALAED